jgi:hypothetical protein
MADTQIADPPVPEGVHAAIHRVEAPQRELMLDRARPDAEREQLSPSDDAVLAPGQGCQVPPG